MNTINNEIYKRMFAENMIKRNCNNIITKSTSETEQETTTESDKGNSDKYIKAYGIIKSDDSKYTIKRIEYGGFNNLMLFRIYISNDYTNILSSTLILISLVEKCYEDTENGLYTFKEQPDLFYNNNNNTLYYKDENSEFKQINHLPIFDASSNIVVSPENIASFKQFMDNNSIKVTSNNSDYTCYLALYVP